MDNFSRWKIILHLPNSKSVFELEYKITEFFALKILLVLQLFNHKTTLLGKICHFIAAYFCENHKKK